MQVLRDLLDGGDDVGQIWILGLAQRRRDADIHRIERGKRIEVRRRAKPAGGQHLLEVAVGHIAHMRASVSDALDFRRVDVDAGRMEPAARELHEQREADIAEADDADAGFTALQLVNQRLTVRIHGSVLGESTAAERRAADSSICCRGRLMPAESGAYA